MTNPVATQPAFDDVVLLLCPRCGEDYLHHGKVEVFDRTEDAATGTHTTTGTGPNGPVTVDRDLTGNPSARRHGLTVAFWCEQCDGNSDGPGPGLRLNIAQHKGQTFLSWEELA